MKKRGIRLAFNAPAVLIFVLLCALARVLDTVTGGTANRAVFSVYRSGFNDPLTYVRAFTHVLGHADNTHLMNNMLYVLILGPMLEEKYGSVSIALVMLVTALVTGIANMVFFPNVMLLGASGIVFAMILLSSITATPDGTIPITFVLVAVLYAGQQIYEGLFTADNVSQFTHIAGGMVGTVLGFVMNRTTKKRI